MYWDMVSNIIDFETYTDPMVENELPLSTTVTSKASDVAVMELI